MNEADIVAAKIAAKRKKLEEAAARRRSSSSDTTGSADLTGSTDSTGSTDLTGSTDTTGEAAATPPPATPPPITPPPVSSPPPATPEPAKPPKTHVELSAPAAVKPAATVTPASPAPPRPPSARTQAAPAPAPPVPPPATVVTEPALPPWLLAVAALAVVIIIVMVMRSGPKDVEPPAPGPITQPATTEATPIVTPATEAPPPPATEAAPPPATEAPPPPASETPPPPASETPPPPASETPPPTTTQAPPPPPVTPPPAAKVDASHVAPVVSATSALGRVDVSWTPSTDSHHVVVRAYEVLRRPVAGGEWTKIGDTAGDARAHADTTAPVGTGSVYKVVSVASPSSDAVLAAGADRAESAVSPPAMPIREFVVIPVSVTVPTEEEQARNPDDKGVASVTVHRWDPETSSYQRKIFRVQVGAPVGLPDKLRGGRAFDFTTGASLDEVRVETRKHPTLGHDRQVQVISLRFADGTTEEFDDTMEPPK